MRKESRLSLLSDDYLKLCSIYSSQIYDLISDIGKLDETLLLYNKEPLSLALYGVDNFETESMFLGYNKLLDIYLRESGHKD